MSSPQRVRAGGRPLPATERIWYAAYGSNMADDRLRCYLAGGCPPGGSRTYGGARDPRMPARSEPVELPGAMYFATMSPVWKGGRAFYDPDADGTVWGRARLVTVGQFADIAAQEMYEAPGRDLDLAAVLAEGRAEVRAGRYGTLVCPGEVEGIPLVTFTAPWRMADVEWTAPSAPYVRLIAAGLGEAGAWDADRIAGYLASRPGAEGHWTAEDVRRLMAAA
ncbi:histone deacetylase [Streptomyces sp. NPDC049040]|uniref:histone deacetylase n=1 Tax=Streptomyces sp. NPDC049040 TaxID=3365593 RepID=UPI00371AE841